MLSLLRKSMLALLLMCAYTQSKAQETSDYRTAIGVRLGGLQSGITFKGFINPNSALEGILGFHKRAFVVTGLYEYHRPFTNAQGLKWFVGGGAHVGFFRYYDGYWYYPGYYEKKGKYYYYTGPYGPYYDPYRDGTRTIVGVDFIMGLDYKFPNAPVNLTLDLKPFMDFVPDGPYGWFDGALSVRFAF